MLCCGALKLMCALALLLPFHPRERRIPDHAGQSIRRCLPKEAWFDARLQQHAVTFVAGHGKLFPKTPQSEFNERTCSLMVHLVPDLEYRGVLTNWDKEAKMLWNYFQYPADAYTLHIAAGYKFSRPLKIATDVQRVKSFVWSPSVGVDWQGLQVTRTSNSRESFELAQLQRVLGIAEQQWQDFLQKPLCILTPAPMLALAEHAAWSKVMLRACWSHRMSSDMQRLVADVRFPSELWVQQLVATQELSNFSPPPQLPLSADHAAHISQRLRDFAPALLRELLDEEARAAEVFDLEQMVSRLDFFASTFKISGSKNKIFDGETLVATCAAAMQLKSRATLRQSVQRVFDQVFPGCEVAPSSWSKVPSPSTISRAQLLLDAALCGVMRDRFASSRSSLFMFADSSPQAGHDYLLSTCLMISAERLENCYLAAQSLRVSWSDFLSAYRDEDADAMRDIIANRQECTLALTEGLTVHRMLPMALGSGASNLDHKSRVLARAFFAETQSLPLLQQTLSRVVSVTTDMGTELALADMAGPRLQEVLPSWLNEGGLEADVDGNGAPPNIAELDLGQEYFAEYFLPRAIAVPGLNHIVELERLCLSAITTLLFRSSSLATSLL